MAEDFWSRIRQNQGPALRWGNMTQDTASDARRFDAPNGNTINTLGNFRFDADPWGGVGLSGGATTNTTGLNNGSGGQRFLQDWIYGGNQLGGGKYLGNSQWAAGAPIAAGTDLHSLGYATSAGYALPTSYDSSQDTFRGELKGEVGETSWSRALRKAQDMVINGQADWNTAIRQSIALVNQEAAAAGKSTGFGAATAYGDGRKPSDGAGVSAGGNASEPWTYQKQAQEGTDVVMPNLDPTGGGGQGGTMPGQQPGGTGNPLFNEGLAGEKSLRLAYLLEKLGLNTPMSRRNMYTSSVADRVGSVMDPWMQTQGLGGGDPGAHQQDLLGKLAGYFQQGGGGMGSVAGDARTAVGQVMNDPRYTGDKGGLRDQELLALLSGFNQLSSLPQNDWLQRAFGNMREDLAGDYARFNANPATFGTGDILSFIKNNPIYGFMTGQK